MWGTSSHFTAGWTLLLLGVPPHPAPSQAQFPNLEVGGSPRLPASPGISGDRAGPDQGDSVARARVPRGARTRVLALQPPHGPIPMASLQGGRGAAAAGGGARPAATAPPPHQSAGSSRAKDERAVARVGKQGREQMKRRAGQMTAGLEL